ncbi:MAG: response regulator [Anaerolineales bacterium]|nr:response regulator [Anaerolineales bacterium]MCB0005270.1 response regulator [Anaerolineales bacterium]MCB0016797.1 response regulator [Anaerolineales bacterium]MCB0029568.1 response regulator [Anaerolineales bacterium]MCB8960547.1 response regulator [Ardenticatenales bacterium]
MNNGRILIVEDDFDIANMLQIYFAGQGYQVEVANRGNAALDMTRRQLPDLVILDIMLPDMDGYEICRVLRTTTRTSHIPIIFLTQKDERGDRIEGLELGADDYITKPFDIEELKLRVRGAIRTHQRTNNSDPRTGLPSSRLIEEELRNLPSRSDWALIEVGIENMAPFNDVYGFVAANEVLRFTALLLNKVVDDHGTINDFIGHTGSEIFIIITDNEHAEPLTKQLQERFAEESQAHYNFMDREQGGIRLHDGSLAPFMSLSMGTVSSGQPFSDIREITELAAERRRAQVTEA